jgi:hypothetical protein
MTAANLLVRAQVSGLILWRVGDRLRYRGTPEAVGALLPELRALKAEVMAILRDAATQARRLRVLRMLANYPDAGYACVSDTEVDLPAVMLTLAIRDRGVFDVWVPRQKWDGVLFLQLLERHCRLAMSPAPVHLS